MVTQSFRQGTLALGGPADGPRRGHVSNLELTTLGRVHRFDEDRLHGSRGQVPPVDCGAASSAGRDPAPRGLAAARSAIRPRAVQTVPRTRRTGHARTPGEQFAQTTPVEGHRVGSMGCVLPGTHRGSPGGPPTSWPLRSPRRPPLGGTPACPRYRGQRLRGRWIHVVVPASIPAGFERCPLCPPFQPGRSSRAAR